MTGPRRPREDALACFRAAVAAVDPEVLVRSFLAARPELARVPGSVRVAAVGKAAGTMTRGAAAALGPDLAGGVILLPAGQEAEAPPGFQVHGAGHPVPSAAGVEGAAALLALADGLGEGDLLLCLISGGGSSLATLPPDGVPLAAVQATTTALLRAGATIREFNTVRKHLDRLKGGRLARAAAPARVLALVLSDVVGDPLDVIASGPVSPDPTTFADAVAVLECRGLWPDGVPGPVREHMERGVANGVGESPGPRDPAFDRVEVHVVGDNRLAATAAVREAERTGYRTLLLSTLVTGEAREVGRVLAAVGAEVLGGGGPVAPPACLVAAGETTVTVTGKGRGGRNQEVALGAALALDELLGDESADAAAERLVVFAAGTDGIDGPTDAAGALATATTVRRGQNAGVDARRALADNDAYPFFDALGDLFVTGPTGTNVMDLMLVLVSN